MTEVNFAKQFLSALDSRPVKLSSDHVADPRTYPPQAAYILPRMPKPMRKRQRTEASAGDAQSLTVHIKALRSPLQAVTLESQSYSTSIHEVKTTYAQQTGIAPEKIKVLYAKKPCADSKTLREVIGEDATKDNSMELSVMVIGGGAAGGSAAKNAEEPAEVPPSTSPADAKPSKAAEVATDEFWEDLKGFLLQRTKDESESIRLATLFRQAWEKDQ